jgi:hypothetical protein
MTIDYALMSKQHPKQKAALTRALHIADPKQRRAAVIAACRKATAEWDIVGAWPDDWSRWQRALDDQFPVFNGPDLRDLESGRYRPEA